MQKLHKPFLQHYPMTISTLSPIHIGCGEDYEPTNYVMIDQCLQYFNSMGLSNVLNDDDIKKLESSLSARDPLIHLQKFIYDRKEKFASQSVQSRVVTKSLFEKYEKVVGKSANIESDGGKIVNKLEIARTAYNSHTQLPVILGSSIKGSMRTAWLNHLNNGKDINPKPRNSRDLEKELLKGNFSEDPFRLVKVADAEFVASHSVRYPEILFENNIKRVQKQNQKPARQLLCLMREIIPEFNVDSFRGSLTLQDLLDVSHEKIPKSTISFVQLVKACNKFYQAILKKELKRFSVRGCLKPLWEKNITEILHLLEPFISQNEGVVLRVGRHSGAESVTIEGVRSIKIMQGPGKKPRYEKEATTDWLASEVEKSEQNLMPFGWLFIDFGSRSLQQERAKLQQFMQTISSDALREQERLFKKVADHLKEIKTQQELWQREENERRERELVAKKAAEEKERQLALMSPEQKEIINLRVRLEKNEDKNGGAGCKLASDLRMLLEQAVTWPMEYRQECYEMALKLLEHLKLDRKDKKWKERLQPLKPQ